jgi:hypothetical protein
MTANEPTQIVLQIRLSAALANRVRAASAARSISLEDLLGEVIAGVFPAPAPHQSKKIEEPTGYRWKNVFLPEGTVLYFNYRGTKYYARVVGTEIVYDGKPMSPSEFVNIISGAPRNAWRDIWVKKPMDPRWETANDLRREVTRAMLFGNTDKATLAALAADGALAGAATLRDQRHRLGDRPISPRMAPRYLAACKVVLRAINTHSIAEADLEHVSQAKGMFNRVVREDRIDWQDLKRILGLSDKASFSQAAFWLTKLRLLAKDGASISDHCTGPTAEMVATALTGADRELELGGFEDRSLPH